MPSTVSQVGLWWDPNSTGGPIVRVYSNTWDMTASTTCTITASGGGGRIYTNITSSTTETCGPFYDSLNGRWMVYGGGGVAPSIVRPISSPNIVRARAIPPEELARMEEVRLRMEWQNTENTERIMKERREATARAQELLLSFLTPEQRQEFLSRGWFTATGRSGRRYRVRRGNIANIDVAQEGNLMNLRLCVHPINAHELPVEDVMLSQLLHIRHDDDALFSKANKHPGPHGDRDWRMSA